ncbi:CDP-alcohol phosphatidyltransferase family protein [Tardiphaga sp.]|uniref:CDP-alcohol phosphatidyltransferase family protein n=1 Tax=Tardiphaga sp. TaxID=1926292 RepID=UPI00352AD66A
MSANAVSVGGLILGAFAAVAFAQWSLASVWVWAGLGLACVWLIADGLDGMIARATGTASALGRLLDGLCDHGVFILIYIGLATSIGTQDAWFLAIAAGAAHALQANLYEGERARFHDRGNHGRPWESGEIRNVILQAYDRLSAVIDRQGNTLARVLQRTSDPHVAEAYADLVRKPLWLMSLLSANVRVGAIFFACLVKAPALFWWFELGPLNVLLIIGVVWRNRIDAQFVRAFAASGEACGHPSPPIHQEENSGL